MITQEGHFTATDYAPSGSGAMEKFVSTNDAIDEPTRLVKSAFAYAFSIVTLSTTGGEGIEVNNDCGFISQVMRLLINKYGVSLTYFDKNVDSQNAINGSSLNQILIDSHEQLFDREKNQKSFIPRAYICLLQFFYRLSKI